MNLVTAQTFLAILKAGNLNRAAEQLNVTQSTVTMRINSLEDQLGRRLIVRNKSGVELTNAGFKFQRYAEMMIQAWHQAKQDIALPKDYDTTFNLGVEIDLWPNGVSDWVPWSRQMMPGIALSVWTGESVSLVRWLQSNLVDAAVMYGPNPCSGFETDILFHDRLILVSRQKRRLTRWDPAYIYVDWGEQFRRDHALAYPAEETAGLTFGEGAQALEHMLAHGGSGYFPLRLVADRIHAKDVFVVPKAPEFRRQVILCRSPLFSMTEWYRASVDKLREIGKRFETMPLQTRPWKPPSVKNLRGT